MYLLLKVLLILLLNLIHLHSQVDNLDLNLLHHVLEAIKRIIELEFIKVIVEITILIEAIVIVIDN